MKIIKTFLEEAIGRTKSDPTHLYLNLKNF